MNGKLSKYLYIAMFAALYLCVGFTSTLHAVQFFELSNVPWMAVILAVAFEIGQAAVLFAILTNAEQRTKFMPWALMSLLTIVQILGNVYASYKYIIINSANNLRFFKEPVFVWTSMPDEQTTVILTYIASGILPIVALCLTAMMASYLGGTSSSQAESIKAESIKADNLDEAGPSQAESPEADDSDNMKPDSDEAFDELPEEAKQSEPQMITDAAPEPVASPTSLKKTHVVSL